MLHVLTAPADAALEYARGADPALQGLQLLMAAALVVGAARALRAAQRRKPVLGRVASLSAAVVVALLATGAWAMSPTQQVAADTRSDCFEDRGWDRFHELVDNHDRRTIELERRDCRIRIRMDGEVRLTSDLKGIASVSPGGRFEAEVDGDSEYELTVRRAANGELTYDWEVEGRRRAFDAAGRAWLAEVLAVALRSSSFALEDRVALLLREGGHDAVLAEIPRLRADHVRQAYLSQLLEQSRVNAMTARRIIELGAAHIASDHELSRILRNTASRFPSDGAVLLATATATATIESDHEQARTLAHLLPGAQRSPRALHAVLRAATAIGSDHELARLLRGVSAPALNDAETRRLYFAAVQGIASDHEHARLLTGLIGSDASAPLLHDVLVSARAIASDHELARLLVAVADAHPLSGELRTAYLAAAREVESQHEHGRVASALLRQDARGQR